MTSMRRERDSEKQKILPAFSPSCERSLRRLSVVLVTLALVACGGCSKPPTTANESVSVEEPAGAESAGDKKDSDGEAADKSEKSEKSEKSDVSAAEATTDDRKAVLQLVIEDEELGKFLRVTEPGRFPLKVSGSDIPSGLVKATKPIEIVDSPAPKAAVLVITSVEIGAKHATVTYRYDVEGIKGTTTLDKGPRGWEILRSRIVEHFRADSKK
jgi:hypothetical protein